MRTLALLACLALAGCQTARFPLQNAHAPTISGQMHYAGKTRSFVGEFTARISPTDFQLDVTKGFGVALMSIHQNDTLARFEGGGHSWQGNPQHFTPGPLRSWLALRDVFLDRARTDVRVTRSEGQIVADFPRTGERFAFQFSR